MKKILTEIELKRHIYKKVFSILNEDYIYDKDSKEAKDAIEAFRLELIDGKIGRYYKELGSIMTLAFYVDGFDNDKYIFKIPINKDKYRELSIMVPAKDYVEWEHKKKEKGGQFYTADYGSFKVGKIEEEISIHNQNMAVDIAKSCIQECLIGFLDPIDKEYDKIIHEILGLNLYGETNDTVIKRLDRNIDTLKWKIRRIDKTLRIFDETNFDKNSEIRKKLNDIKLNYSKATKISELKLIMYKAKEQEGNEKDFD